MLVDEIDVAAGAARGRVFLDRGDEHREKVRLVLVVVVEERDELGLCRADAEIESCARHRHARNRTNDADARVSLFPRVDERATFFAAAVVEDDDLDVRACLRAETKLRSSGRNSIRPIVGTQTVIFALFLRSCGGTARRLRKEPSAARSFFAHSIVSRRPALLLNFRGKIPSISAW